MSLPFEDPILVFATLMAVILMVPLFAERVKIPDVVLLLVCGAALGPSGFGVLDRNSAIMLFGSVGLLYIMFLAGLEVDLHRFSRNRKKSVIFGLLTFAIPQILGTLMAHYGLGMSWMASILLASMFASHTLLTYPVASRLGIVRLESIAVTIGATIITDTLALLVLAVIADSARGIELSVLFFVQLAVGMIVFAVVAWKGIPFIARKFFRNTGENGSAQFVFVLAIVCIFSYMSHYAQMEPIIGAFLIGLAFNRLIPEHSTLMNRIDFIGNTIFIPVFLLSVGMLINPAALIHDVHTWIVAVSMTLTVIVTKYIAARVAAKFFKYDRNQARVMFGLTVVQAAATLAAVMIGYNLEIFDDAVLNGTIVMIMITSPIGSWFVDRFGRRVAVSIAGQEPVNQTEQRLLVPVSNADSALRLLDVAFLLRDDVLPGVICPVTIVEENGETDLEVARGEKLLAHCSSYAASAEMSVNPGVRVGLNAVDGIVRAAKEMRAGLAIIGWGNERSMASRFFGSVMDNLLDDISSRLMICRIVNPLNTTRRIIVPCPPFVEKRSDIRFLLHELKMLAERLGAELVFIVTGNDTMPVLQKFAQKLKMSVPVSYHEAREWRESLNWVFGKSRTDDLIAVPLDRNHGASWSPSMSGLPVRLVSRIPGLNFLFVFPSPDSAVLEDLYTSTKDQSRRRVITISYDFDSEDDDVTILEKIVAENAGQMTDEQQLSLVSFLHESAKEYPVEMVPGVVLLHAHSDAVEGSSIYVCARRNGWQFAGIEEKALKVVVLISSLEQQPGIHLQVLSDLARVFLNKAISERFLLAESGDIASNILEDALCVSCD